ncbi:hypothetical protein V490_01627 [Pseudogymnoascus sp. VKM F-3557]|nr:hypothetical protein V490_01627 [Pseudogymnoascus sp. VKM F-3557]
MPPKKERKTKPPPQKTTLLQFYKRIPPKPETKDAGNSVYDKPLTTTTKKENEQPASQPEPAGAQSFSSEPRVTSSQRIIRDSDDDENDSSDSDPDLPGHSLSHTTFTTATNSKGGGPILEPEPFDSQSSCVEAQIARQLAIEGSREESDHPDESTDLPEYSPSQTTSTIVTSRKNGQPRAEPNPADTQPFSGEPRISSQLTIEDSDEESPLSDAGSDQSELSVTHTTSHLPTTFTNGEDEQHSPQPEPSQSQASSIIIPTYTKWENSSDSDSDLPDIFPSPTNSHTPISRSTPTREQPAAGRTATSRAAPYPKRIPKPKTKDAGSSLSDTPPTTTTTKKRNGHPRSKPESTDAQSISNKTEMTDDSDSDSDLPDLHTAPTTSRKPTSRSTGKRITGSTAKSKPYIAPLTFQPKQEYKFSLTSLVNQSLRHGATEASAQRAKSILDEPKRGDTGKHGDKEALLESVIADKDASNADKILQAVARTESTVAEKRWYFFDPDSETPSHKAPKIPANSHIPVAYRKWDLGHKVDREERVGSGIVMNMIPYQEELSEKFFLWILDMACTEPTSDLGTAYFNVLVPAPEAIFKYLRPETVKSMFDRLGALPHATDWKAPVEAVDVYKAAYKKRDWSILLRYIKFLGHVAGFTTPSTCGYTITLLARLCADTLVQNTPQLLSATKYTMNAHCQAIKEDEMWEILCRQICSNIYKTVTQEPLCLQILNCIPDFTSRPRDLRRRLSLAVFSQDCDVIQKPTDDSLELQKLVQVLNGPKFQINRNTDYVQLSALIGLVNIVIDDKFAADLISSDPQAEDEFNSGVDELSFLLKVIWSSINDRGTLSPSRIHTKRTVEKLRNRLMEMVRGRLKPKHSIFDLPGQGGDREGALKQSAFMTRHFKKPITNE